MATRSTPSSGTDGPDPTERPADDAPPQPRAPDTAPDESEPGPPDPVAAEPPVDTERRAFFMRFGKQTLSAVGQVAGMTDAASRTANAIASELLGLEEPAGDRPAFTRSGATSDPVVSAAEPAADDAFRSAYRLAGQKTDSGATHAANSDPP